MKKWFAALIVVSLVVVLLSGCSTPKAGESAQAPKSEGKAGSPELTFKLGFNTAEDSPRDKAAHRFADLVAERTNGRIKIEIYPAETLGTEQEMVEAVHSGALDFQAAGGGALSSWVPAIDYVKLPFLFENYDEAYKTQDGPLGDKVAKMVREKGFVPLAWWDLGFCQITNNVRPIEKPEDLKGIKLRVPNEFIQVEVFKQLGASVTTMPYSEVYLALAQGVIDGQHNPISSAYYSKFYEHQKYLSMTNHMYYNVIFIASEKAWNQIPDDLKPIVEQAAKEAGAYSRELVQQEEKDLLKKWEEYGVKVNYPDLKPFQEATKPVYQTLAPKMGADIIQEAQDFVAQLRSKK